MAVLLVISLLSAAGNEIWKNLTNQRWYLVDNGTLVFHLSSGYVNCRVMSRLDEGSPI